MRYINKPKSITNDDANKLMQSLDYRPRIIFDLACQTGLRISDILDLRVRDLHNPLTVYEHKSKRKRTAAITDKLHKCLDYMTDYKSSDDYIFDSDRKRGVSTHRSTIHRKIKKAGKEVNVDCSTHSARKLYAQNALQELGSPERVQKLLHHRKLSTTMTYLDLPQHNETTTIETATHHPGGNIISQILNAIKKFFRR